MITYPFFDILENIKSNYNILQPGTDCPRDEMLLDYVENVLKEDKKEIIVEHIRTCERCYVEILKMEADYTEWEYMVNNNPDAALAKALGDVEKSELKIPDNIFEIIKNCYYTFEDARGNYDTLTQGKDCPSDEMLLDYAEGVLEEDKKEIKEIIDKHIQNCERCHMEILKMEADFTEWEYSLNKNPDAFLSKSLGTSGAKKILNFKKRMIKTIKGLRVWISSLWFPQWAGVPATASEIPEQRHSFKIDEGEINLFCYWKPNFGNDPAYIHLSWNAKITISARLWVRFVNSETQEVFSEICLGTQLQGEDNFTSDRLGFDPSNEKWAVSIIFEETE
jgi:hypothetical protein